MVMGSASEPQRAMSKNRPVKHWALSYRDTCHAQDNGNSHIYIVERVCGRAKRVWVE